MMKFHYNDKGCRKVFKTYKAQMNKIKSSIEAQIEKQLDNHFAKVKVATRTLVDGHKCYECRVNIGKLPNIRVAFYVEGQEVTVVYISSTLQKDMFTHELDHLIGEMK